MSSEQENNMRVDPIIEQLFTLCDTGTPQEVQEYLLVHPWTVNMPNRNRKSPLFYALLNKKTDIAKVLLLNKADVNFRDENDTAPIHVAACYGQVDVVQCFVDSGADVNIKENKRNTPLHYAARMREVNMVKALVILGADIEAKSFYEWTPLHIAARYGYVDVVQYFVNSGADMEAKSFHEWTPLHIAACYGHVDVVQCFVNSGADVNIKGYNEYTPLYVAAKHGQIYVVKELLNLRADIEAKTSHGDTPMHCATHRNHLDVVKVLLAHGACVEVQEKDGYTPMHIAAYNGYIEIVKLLGERGCDVNNKAVNGFTALHYAAQKGNLNVVTALLKLKAKVNVMTPEHGITPIMCAIDGNHGNVIDLLLSYSSDLEMSSVHTSTILNKLCAQLNQGTLPVPLGFISLTKHNLYEKNMQILAYVRDKILYNTKQQQIDCILEIIAGLSILYGTKESKVTLSIYSKIHGCSIHDLISKLGKKYEPGNSCTQAELIATQQVRYVCDDYLNSKLPEYKRHALISSIKAMLNQALHFKISQVKPLWMIALDKGGGMLIQQYPSQQVEERLSDIDPGGMDSRAEDVGCKLSGDSIYDFM